MASKIHFPTIHSPLFRWLARFFLISASVAALVLSFFPSLYRFHYVYPELAYHRISPEVAFVFVLPLVIITAIAWFWPRAGGSAAVAWATAILLTNMSPYTTLFFPIWSVFLAGGVIHLFIPQKTDRSLSVDEKLNLSAIIISFTAPLCYLIILVLVSTLKLPAGLGAGLFYSPFAMVFAVLAIYKPFLGGTLMMFSGSLLFSTCLMSDHYPQYYMPISSLSIISAFLHLIRAE